MHLHSKEGLGVYLERKKNLIMVISSLDIIRRLIIPSVILAFLTEQTRCFEGFKSFEIITLKLRL